MSSALNDWRQTIQPDTNLLAMLESRQRELEKAQHAAQLALDSAQARYNAFTSQIADIAVQCTALRMDIARMLHKPVSARLLQRIPPELLRMVFVELILSFERADKWPAIAHGSQKELIRVPFALAAVCRQWRNLALHSPELWSFISIPPNNRKLPPYATRLVKTMLERSKYQVLDVLLPWQADDETAWASRYNNQESHIIELLGQQCYRWRRFELHTPAGALSRKSMGLFRGATPLLEEFCILGEGADDILAWTAISPDFLPSCPKLRYFRSECSNIVVSPNNATLQQISQLELFVDLPFAVVLGILQLAAPSLRMLDLQFSRQRPLDESQYTLPSHLTFARLEELIVLNQGATMLAATAGLVSFPALITLHASAESLASLLPVWENFPNKIAKLDILFEDLNPLQAENAQSLRPYTNVDRLLFPQQCIASATFLRGRVPPGSGSCPV